MKVLLGKMHISISSSKSANYVKNRYRVVLLCSFILWPLAQNIIVKIYWHIYQFLLSVDQWNSFHIPVYNHLLWFYLNNFSRNLLHYFLYLLDPVVFIHVYFIYPNIELTHIHKYKYRVYRHFYIRLQLVSFLAFSCFPSSLRQELLTVTT